MNACQNAQNPSSVHAFILITPNNTPLLLSLSHNSWSLAVLSDNAGNIPNFFIKSTWLVESCHWLLWLCFSSLCSLSTQEPRCWQWTACMAAKKYFDETAVSLLFCCAPQHCAPALRWDSQIHGSTQLASAPANCCSSLSQMFMQSPHWWHLALCVDLIQEHSKPQMKNVMLPPSKGIY